MAETIPGGRYLAPDGKTYRDAKGNPIKEEPVVEEPVVEEPVVEEPKSTRRRK